MKSNTLILAVFLFITVQLGAQQVVGLSRNASSEYMIQHYDYKTNTLVNEFLLDSISIVRSQSQTALNPIDKEFYFAGSDLDFEFAYYRVNFESGSVSKNLRGASQDIFTKMDWNKNDSLLYGLIRKSGGQFSYAFGTYDFDANIFNEILEFEDVSTVLTGAINELDNSYLIVLRENNDPAGSTRFYTIDIENQVILSNVLCDSNTSLFCQGIDISSITGDLYGMNEVWTNQTFERHEIIDINAAQCDTDNVSILDTTNVISTRDFAYDISESSILLTANFDSDPVETCRLIELDPVTGSILSSNVLSETMIHIEHYELQETSSTKLLNNSNRLTIFPNPSSGKINIQSESPISKVEVLNSLGRRVQTSLHSNKLNVELHLESLNSGFYFLKISETDQSNQIVSFIIN